MLKPASPAISATIPTNCCPSSVAAKRHAGATTKNNAIRFALAPGQPQLQLAPAVITWAEDCTTLEFTLSNGKVYSSAHIDFGRCSC